MLGLSTLSEAMKKTRGEKVLFRRRESEIQVAIVKVLRQLGFLVFHIPNQATRGLRRYSGMVSGAPDLVVLKGGRVWFFEVKTDRGRQSYAQKAIGEALASEGFTYAIVRSVDDVLKVLGHA
jgi:Holliday junction resolvase